MPKTAGVKLALVDDHVLVRKGIKSLLEEAYSDYTILFDAADGNQMIEKIDENNPPDIILMDINMKGMDGYESVQWLKDNKPLIKVIILSVLDTEEAILRMLTLGVKGYLGKNQDTRVIGEAIETVMKNELYFPEFVTGRIIHSLQKGSKQNEKSAILSLMNQQEKKFLQLACSELTYYEIADRMNLSPKTIDGYRNSLFEKLNVKSRVGLALYAIKHELVEL